MGSVQTNKSPSSVSNHNPSVANRSPKKDRTAEFYKVRNMQENQNMIVVDVGGIDLPVKVSHNEVKETFDST